MPTSPALIALPEVLALELRQRRRLSLAFQPFSEALIERPPRGAERGALLASPRA